MDDGTVGTAGRRSDIRRHSRVPPGCRWSRPDLAGGRRPAVQVTLRRFGIEGEGRRTVRGRVAGGSRASRGHEVTPRAPARARLPLLPSSPGGVQRDDTTRGVAHECSGPGRKVRGGVRYAAQRVVQLSGRFSPRA